MPTDITIPTIGESISSGVVSRWTRADGDYVKRDDAVAELETDKVTMEILAPEDGVLKRSVAEGATVAVGSSIGQIVAGQAPAASAPSKVIAANQVGSSTAVAAPAKVEVKPTAPMANGDESGHARATPLAKKLAAEHNVDISKLPATGAGGRVREQDVRSALPSSPSGRFLRRLQPRVLRRVLGA